MSRDRCERCPELRHYAPHQSRRSQRCRPAAGALSRAQTTGLVSGNLEHAAALDVAVAVPQVMVQRLEAGVWSMPSFTAPRSSRPGRSAAAVTAATRSSLSGRVSVAPPANSVAPATTIHTPASSGDGCSPVGPSMPERTHEHVVVLLAAHAGPGHGAVAVANDQLPARGIRARPQDRHRRRGGHRAAGMTGVAVGVLVLRDDGALAA